MSDKKIDTKESLMYLYEQFTGKRCGYVEVTREEYERVAGQVEINEADLGDYRHWLPEHIAKKYNAVTKN